MIPQSLIKTGAMRLSPISDEWPTQILEFLYSRYPSLRGRDLVVQLDKYDEKTGSALGKVVIRQSSNEQIFLPVVIKEGNLEDIDIIIRNGKPWPLVDDEIVSLFGADIIDATFGISSLPFSSSFYLSAQTTPGQTTAGYKIASDFLAELSEKVPAELKEKVLRNIAYDCPSLLTYPDIKRFFTIESKIASAKEDYDSVYIKNRKAYAVKLNPFSITILKVADNGPKVLKRRPGGRIVLPVKEASASDKFGVYEIEHQGDNIKGLFVPRLTDFHHIYNTGIVIHPKGISFVEKVAGDFIGAPKIEKYHAEPKGYGVFFFVSPKTAVASYPVTIVDGLNRKLVKTATDEWELVTEDTLRVPVIHNSRLFIPSSWKFIPIKEREVVAFHGSKAEKAAAAYEALPYIVYFPDNNTYSFRKLAHIPKRGFEEDEAKAILLAVGLDSNQSDKALLISQKLGRAYFEPGNLPKNSNVLEKLCEDLRIDLSKEAAELYPDVTPDTLFSLNFVTPETLDTLTNALPLFHDTLEKLAGLLLANRLGVKSLPENSIKTAIRGLYKVAHALEVLRWKQK